jgi:membrane protease YdiL (CAAX protease family)
MARVTARRCWLSWAILGFGLPTLISGVSSLMVQGLPVALHGSVAQRFLLSISGALISEWLFVIVLWLVLKSRNQSLRDLGTWQYGSLAAWTVALLVAGLSIGSNLRLLPRMNISIVYAFAPQGFHLMAALALGITAGFCEEVLFRAFLMTEFAQAGYGKLAQVVLPGIAFGFAHLGYFVHGFIAGVGIMVPTAVLGMLWGVAYLLGRRGLVPCIVAHFLNDSTALPWIAFFMFSGGSAR